MSRGVTTAVTGALRSCDTRAMLPRVVAGHSEAAATTLVGEEKDAEEYLALLAHHFPSSPCSRINRSAAWLLRGVGRCLTICASDTEGKRNECDLCYGRLTPRQYTREHLDNELAPNTYSRTQEYLHTHTHMLHTQRTIHSHAHTRRRGGWWEEGGEEGKREE